MPTKDIQVFYIGTGPELDTDENNWNTENMSSLLGNTYGSVGTPLYQSRDTLTLNDADGDGFLREDDWYQIPDQVTFQGVSADMDASMSFTVTVTFDDGTTDTAVVHLLQDVDGRMFLAPEVEAETANNAVLGSKPIQSIRLDTMEGDGHAGQSMSLAASVFICFEARTRIETDRGPRPAGDLVVGDKLRTLDHGDQPVRWVARRTVIALDKGAPMRIAPGALGQGMPNRPLRVSQQHRVLLRSESARDLFGTPEVLVAAHKLSDLPGVALDPQPRLITYVHFLLDRHEIILAEGLPTETLLPGPQAQKIVGAVEDRVEMPAVPARPVIQSRAKVGALMTHHRARGTPLLEPCAQAVNP